MDEDIKTYNKIDIAIKLTNQAIRMFFHKEDDISIHVIISAANEILNKFLKYNKIKTPLGYDSMHIKPEHKKEWINGRKKVYNFSKHADKDINDSITFNPKFNWCLILENILFFQILQIRRSKEMVFFTVWVWRTQKNLFYKNELADAFNDSHQLFNEDFFEIFDDVMANELFSSLFEKLQTLIYLDKHLSQE